MANRVVIPIPVQSKAGSRGVSMVFAAVSQQIYRRVDEWSSRLAHNQEIVGSNPTPATIWAKYENEPQPTDKGYLVLRRRG